MDKESIYDLIITGIGPAGLTASIYASRYKLSNLVIGKTLGGELGLAHKVENYPGFLSISGLDLADKWKKQVENLGAKVLIKEVGKIEKQNGGFLVEINEEEKYQSKAVIVATGSERRRLNIPGEKEYMGRGVSYCHTCDAPFFREKTVALIGGADSAVSGAIHTAEFAKKVYIIYRKDKLRAEPIWIEEWKKLEASGKGEAIYNTNITQILGGKEFAKLKAQNAKLKAMPAKPSMLDKIGTTKNLKLEEKNQVVGVLLNNPYKREKFLAVDGVFIEIGSVPGTALVQSLGVKLDETGHVVVNDQMETNIPGFFCAGDMVSKSATFKQAILAMAQGAMAAASVYKYLKKETAPAIRGV